MPDPSNLPVPDPSTLTTEQMLREISRVKELVETRIDGMERHIDVRFSSIDKHLSIVEKQRVEQKTDTKSAVDAALIAQKEAVREQTTASERAIAKSEAATTKQLEQLNATFTTAISGVTGLLSDLKDRIGKIESIKQGLAEGKTTQRLDVGQIVAIVSLMLLLISVAVTIVLATAH